MQRRMFEVAVAAPVLAVLFAGCAGGPETAPRRADADGAAVVLKAWEEVDGTSCRLGYDLVYPADMPEHVRVLRQRIGTEISPGVPEGALDDFGGPLLYLSDPNQFPLAYGLEQFRSSYADQTHLLLAASVLFTLPPIALFFLAQRTFIQGIATSGLKG